MILFLLSVMFVVLNIFDVTTTNKILKNGGYEANPIARLLMKFNLFLPVKIMMVIIILLMMATSDEETGITLGLICCGIYVFIVLNNIRTIRLQAQE